MASEQIDQDEVVRLVQGLRAEASAAFNAFKKKVSNKGITDVPQLAGEMEDLFSLVVDLGDRSLSLLIEQLEWGQGIEDELDALKEGEDGSALLPTDAEALKSTLLALQQNLRPPRDADDHELGHLTAKVTETLAFIDAITIEEEEEEEETEEEDEDDDEPDSKKS